MTMACNAALLVRLATMFAVALIGLAQAQPAGGSAPRQTAWQRQLFSSVEADAALLSDAARPALLEMLGAPDFRSMLADCCPSVSNFTAEDLLNRLEELLLSAEVVSGFPAVVAPEGLQPDSPGMSIGDGANGSFFLNDWQGVLLHSTDPSSIFHKVRYWSTRASCNAEEGTISLQRWLDRDCAGSAFQNVTYAAGKCIEGGGRGGPLVLQYACSAGILEERVWYAQDSGTSQLQPRSVLSYRDGALPYRECPSGPPDMVTNFTTNGTCDAKAYKNDTDFWLMQDGAEVDLYGLRPFSTPGEPASLEEAAERGPYAMVNTFLLDAGSPLFGDVSAVFSRRAMQRSAILSAVDTGMYEGACALKLFAPWTAVNCSAYPPRTHLGTMQHFAHLLLINANFWRGTAATLLSAFARLEAPWGLHPFRGGQLLTYFEAMPVGKLEYPDDIRFLIGSFGSLFGTPDGEQLREWSRRQGWVLVWALGMNDGSPLGAGPGLVQRIQQNGTFPANQRILDPEVILHSSAAGAVKVSPEVLAAFQENWVETQDLRKRNSSLDNTTWARRWSNLSAALPDRLHVRPFTDTSCFRANPEVECIGMTGDGRCVCYWHLTTTDRRGPPWLGRQPSVEAEELLV